MDEPPHARRERVRLAAARARQHQEVPGAHVVADNPRLLRRQIPFSVHHSLLRARTVSAPGELSRGRGRRPPMLPSSIKMRTTKGKDSGACVDTRYRAGLDAAVVAALAGGAIIKRFYDGAGAATYKKRDGSPVTDADLAADRHIRGLLANRFPNDAILTEEGQDDQSRLSSARCWIVDPLDGTEQFIRRTGEFDVLVALVEHGRPVVAAGFQPTTRTLVTATLGRGAWISRDGSRAAPVKYEPAGDGVRLATSKWFGAPKMHHYWPISSLGSARAPPQPSSPA